MSDRERLEQIISEMTETLSESPDEVEPLVRRASAWCQLGSYENAIADCDLALRAEPGDAKAHYVRGVALGETKAHEDAILDFDEAVAYGLEGEGLDHCLYRRGRCHSALGDYEKAIADFNQAIKGGQCRAAIHLARGLAFARNEDPLNAIADLSDAILLGLDEQNLQICYFSRGRCYYETRAYDEAIDDFDQVLNRDGKDADAYYMRGLALAQSGEHRDAIEDFAAAIAYGIKEEFLVGCYYNRSKSYHSERDFSKAIDDLNEVMRLDTTHLHAPMRRGLAKAELGQYQQAIADYDLAILRKPDSADAFHNRGNEWIQLGKFRKAIADLTTAIRIDPESAVSFNSRGIAWNRKGCYWKALADYERALELDPDSTLRRSVLASFLVNCPSRRYRDGKRALQLITEVCELKGYGDAAIVNCLAAAHAETGDFASAITFQERAISLSEDEEEIEDMQFSLQGYQAGVVYVSPSPPWRQRFA
ncbi:MAG: tetratricopeptide repeat protein [Planctomycetota bacterium]